jgi:hypothetical protein
MSVSTLVEMSVKSYDYIDAELVSIVDMIAANDYESIVRRIMRIKQHNESQRLQLEISRLLQDPRCREKTTKEVR